MSSKVDVKDNIAKVEIGVLPSVKKTIYINLIETVHYLLTLNMFTLTQQKVNTTFYPAPTLTIHYQILHMI